MDWHKSQRQKTEMVEKHAGSIRRAGVRNIFISIVVAAATYYSLTLIAKQFGGSSGSDAYFFVLSLATLASGLIGSLLGTVFLPAFIKLHKASDKKEAHHFASSILSWCVMMACLLAIPTIIWNEQFFYKVSRFNQSQIAQMHQVLQYFAPLFVSGVLVEFFRVMALSLGMYTSAAVGAMFPPFLLIAGIFSLGGVLREEALVLSLLLGKIVALIILVIAVVRSAGVRLHFNLKQNQHTFQFLKTSTPYWSANVITNATSFFFDYQASGLGQGVVTALAFAQRIFQLPTTVFLAPIVEIVRTKFAQFQANGDYESFNRHYNNLLCFSIYFSVPMAAIYIAFSQDIVSALFQRGAFDKEDVDLTASLLSIYAWAIPFTSIFMVNGRACESYQRLFWPSFFGTIGNVLTIVSAHFFVTIAGAQGVPIAKVFSEVIYMLPFGFIAAGLFGIKANCKGVLQAFIASSFASLSILCTNVFANWLSGAQERTGVLWVLIVEIILAVIIYMFLLIVISKNIRNLLISIFHQLSRKISMV